MARGGARGCRHLEPRSTPICRCRVLYLGSAVPHLTKDGLHGIQDPLRRLYPDEGVFDTHGIDSWLSVWSNGLLLENVNEQRKPVTRFFAIESLHYCAAVRCVTLPYSAASVENDSDGESPMTNSAGNTAALRFLPLDSPFLKSSRSMSPVLQTLHGHHPPLFAAILRRTSGIKVLECHAFVCRRAAPAHALVRCCFHAYADSMYARRVNGALYAAIYCGAPLASQSGGRTETQSVEQAHIDFGERSGSDGISHDDTNSGDGNSLEAADLNHRVWQGDGSSRGGGWSSTPSYCGSRCSKKRQRRMPAAPDPPCTPTTATVSCGSSHSQRCPQQEWRSNFHDGVGQASGRRTQYSSRLENNNPVARPSLVYSPQMMVLTRHKNQQQQQQQQLKSQQMSRLISAPRVRNSAISRSVNRTPQSHRSAYTVVNPAYIQHPNTPSSWQYRPQSGVILTHPCDPRLGTFSPQKQPRHLQHSSTGVPRYGVESVIDSSASVIRPRHLPCTPERSVPLKLTSNVKTEQRTSRRQITKDQRQRPGHSQGEKSTLSCGNHFPYYYHLGSNRF